MRYRNRNEAQPEVNQAFRAAVTDVALNLSLSRGMVATLVALHVALERDERRLPVTDIGRPWTRAITSHRIQGHSALVRRGLILHHPPAGLDPNRERPLSDYFTITSAGRLVVELLREAGIYQAIAESIRFGWATVEVPA